jgi:hypothetical protein
MGRRTGIAEVRLGNRQEPYEAVSNASGKGRSTDVLNDEEDTSPPTLDDIVAFGRWVLTEQSPANSKAAA